MIRALTRAYCFLVGHAWRTRHALSGEWHWCDRCYVFHKPDRLTCYGNCPGTELCDAP